VPADRFLDLGEGAVRDLVSPSRTRAVVAAAGGCIWTPGSTPGVWLIAP